MKKSEAYKELELSETASKEETKKQFKKLASKFHPDINKETGAEDKFKKINEAYQSIENDKFDEDFKIGNIPGGWRVNVSDFAGAFSDLDFSNWARSAFNHADENYIVEDISLSETISFKESVLGCKKEIKYNCYIMCAKCQGIGSYTVHNGCKECNGKGKTVSQNKNIFYQQTCKTCKGKIKKESCQDCSEEGRIKTDRTISISIKPGIINGTILRLPGMGNFSGYVGNSNVLITINVISESHLKLEKNDVITEVSISLLQALKGCTHIVNTIDGTQEISIPALSKNKDEVILSKLGVNRDGNERVIVNIEYPSNIDKLIEALE